MRATIVGVAALVAVAGLAPPAPAKTTKREFIKVFRGSTGQTDQRRTAAGDTNSQGENYGWTMEVRDVIKRSGARVTDTRTTTVSANGSYLGHFESRVPPADVSCTYSSSGQKFTEQAGGAFIRSAANDPFVFLSWQVPTSEFGVTSTGSEDCGLPLTNMSDVDLDGINTAGITRAMSGQEKVLLKSLPRVITTNPPAASDTASHPDGSSETGTRFAQSTVLFFEAGDKDNKKHPRDFAGFAASGALDEIGNELEELSAGEALELPMSSMGSSGTVDVRMFPNDPGVAPQAHASQAQSDLLLTGSGKARANRSFPLEVKATPAGQEAFRSPRPARPVRLTLRFDPTGKRKAVSVTVEGTLPAG